MYFLTTEIAGHKYFVGDYRLEGMMDNAVKFPSFAKAADSRRKLEIKYTLFIETDEEAKKNPETRRRTRVHLPKMLRQLRQQKNVTLSQVADAIGIDQRTVGTHEQGKFEPSLNTLIAYAKFYKISIDCLVYGEPSTVPAVGL